MLPAGLEIGDTPARPTGAAQPRDRALGLLLAWGAAALLFAALRTPFDDEWYSLGLAGQRDSARFWAALAADVHPPWVALLDRALLAGTGARWLINLVRVLASAGALTVNATSSLTETENRVRDLLRGLCLRTGATPFGVTPHYALKHLWKADAQPYRFQREMWQCSVVGGPVGPRPH